MEKRHFANLLAAVAMIAAPQIALADSLALSLGPGDHADVAWLVLQLDARKPLREYDASKLTGHLELAAGYARGHAGSEHNNDLAAIGVTPVLRLARSKGDLNLFLEGGIGIRFLSDTTIYDSRRFSTSFQFGELLGMGLRFGSGQAYEIGIRVEHISNGGIKEPNDGINFAVIRFAYHRI